jgi:5,10-methylenetetrahydrofolate reductase
MLPVSQQQSKDCYNSPAAGMSASTRLVIQAVHVGLAVLRPIVKVVGRKHLEKPMAWMESKVKGALFDCQMCGNCMLNLTALRCPTRCKKEVRNGPCGGVRQDGTCELDATMKCAWRDIVEHNGGLLPERLPPREFNFGGRSTWIAEALEGMPAVMPLPAKKEIPAGRLERDLASGDFVLTGEVAPGTAANSAAVLTQAALLAPWVSAINATDAAGANAALSSMASCALMAQNGYTAVLQMTCRDRNRIALQNDLLSATALGIENVLCLTGDGVANGDHPGAKPVFDLDSVSLIAAARTMRDGGTFMSGRALNAPPTYFIGAVENPFAPPAGARVQRLKKKIDAGAQFVMTQMVYDMPSFELFMDEVRRLGLDRRCHILAGVGLLTSPKTARWISKNVPGVRIPEEMVAQLESAAKPMDTGIAMTVEILRKLRAMEGLAGVHLMFHPTRLNLLGDILAQAGLDTKESRRRVSAAVA